MTPSKACLDLVKSFEGLHLKAYPDPKTNGEPYTIGYGTTIYPDGKKVQLGHETTMEQAEKYLLFALTQSSKAVSKWVVRDLTQNQFDALTSFVYNVGSGNFVKSTLLKKVNNNPNEWSIRDEFMRWVSKGTPVEKGLTRRRKAEADLYFS